MAKKDDKISIPKKEFVKEHKRLVNVLNEAGKEGKYQEKELKEVEKAEDYATAPIGPGTGLAGKIARHNMRKLHHFVSAYKIKKSVDFQQTKSAIPSEDQLLAEKTVNSDLINYIKSSIQPDISKINFKKGILTLSQKEPGLYNGFFQDTQGQVIEKFDNQTLEIVAKNMLVKQLIEAPDEPYSSNLMANEAGATVTPPVDVPLQLADAAHDRIDMVQNRIDSVQKQIEEQTGRAKVLKIRFGNDFELELRKSVKAFVNDFRKSRDLESDLIKKAVSSWRRKHKDIAPVDSDHSAARELFSNWEEYKEGFCQIVYGLQQLEQDDE